MRLPTGAEARALLRAFKHDRSHPRGASIASMRVSTAGPWSRVDWVPPAASGSRATTAVKIITVRSSYYSGGPKHPAPAKRPPPKTRKDLDNHIHLRLGVSVTGREDASESTSTPTTGDCLGVDTGRITSNATFSWTEHWDIDLDGIGNPLLLQFVSHDLTPFLGSANDALTSTSQDCDGQPATVTCTTTAGPDHSSALTFIDDTGVTLPSALTPTRRDCSDGSAPDNYDMPRWLRTADLAVKIPLLAGAGGIVNVRDRYDVSFPASNPSPDGPSTGTGLGLCRSTFDTCSDTISWSGTVTARVLA